MYYITFGIWLEMELQAILFWKYQFALINHKIVLIPNKINIFIPKSLRKWFLEEIFLILGPLEFCVCLNTWFFYLHQVKVICYHCYLMLCSKKKILLNNVRKLLCKKSWIDTKCIFHESYNKLINHLAEKCISGVGGVNGTPPNTLKLFFTFKSLINFFLPIIFFFIISIFFIQQFSDNVQ